MRKGSRNPRVLRNSKPQSDRSPGCSPSSSQAHGPAEPGSHPRSSCTPPAAQPDQRAVSAHARPASRGHSLLRGSGEPANDQRNGQTTPWLPLPCSRPDLDWSRRYLDRDLWLHHCTAPCPSFRSAGSRTQYPYCPSYTTSLVPPFRPSTTPPPAGFNLIVPWRVGINAPESSKPYYKTWSLQNLIDCFQILRRPKSFP